jgi:hypothetical protein
MEELESEPVGELQRLVFTVSANRRVHRILLGALNAATPIDEVHCFRDAEDE